MDEHDAATPPDPPAAAIPCPPASQPVSDDESAPDGADRTLARDVTALIATVDQHSSELDTLNAIQMLTIFALGALAGVVFLQARHVRELSGALAG